MYDMNLHNQLNGLTGGGQIAIGDLIQLNNALRKAAEVGYQTPASPTGGASLSPLVPQSIEGALATATHTMKEIILWKALSKQAAIQTVHEYVVTQEHGQDLDPFIGEGGGGTTTTGKHDRRFVKIRYMAERRELTDVANMVGILGSNPTALAQETENGTLSLMRKVEHQLFHGNESLRPDLGFDGILKQIEGAGNVTDKGGGRLTIEDLNQAVGGLGGPPRFGYPDTIYADSQLHSDLIQQAVAFGRHDQTRVEGSKITFGNNRLCIMSPYGEVPIVCAPFLFAAYDMPASGFGDPQPAKPVFDAAFNAGAPEVAADGASKFEAADAGDYIYAVIAVGEKGYSDPLVIPAQPGDITLGAGDRVAIELDDLAAQGGSNPIRYYRVYRTAKNGAVGTFKLLDEIAVNTDGTSGGTRYVDLNNKVYNGRNCAIVSHDPSKMAFIKLLDFVRRPLHSLVTTMPFLLMLFGSPVIKTPSQMWVFRNCGV